MNVSIWFFHSLARNNSIPKRWNYPVPDEFRDDPDFQDQVEQEDGE